MRTIPIFLLLSTLSLSASAQIEQVINALSAPIDPSAVACDPETGVRSCAALTDNFCSELWSPERNGNVQAFDGRIEAGPSPKSRISRALLSNVRALLDGEANLPADLKAKSAEIFPRIRELLSQEADTRDWYRDFSRASQSWMEAIEDVGIARTEAANPQLRNRPPESLSIEEAAKFNQTAFDIDREITDAKYINSPVWQRVERVFNTTRANMITEIQLLPLPAEQKQLMLKQVETIELTLPYKDPNLLGAQEGCNSSVTNAFYAPPPQHKFTVCAGLFNSFQSDNVISMVVGHEISHAIDPVRIASLINQAAHPNTQLDLFLASTEAVPAGPCADWRQAAIILPTVAPKLNLPRPLAALNDCLISKEGLYPLDFTTIHGAAESYARFTMNNFAQANIFTRLAQPTISKDGREEPNPIYLNPRRLEALQRGVMISSDNRQAQATDFFATSFACQMEANPSDRTGNFQRAMAETTTFLTSKFREWFATCGNNCPELVQNMYARDPSENFADWMGSRARARDLALLPEADRMRAATEATAYFCSPPSALTTAPDFTEIEKTFSFAPHPDNRVRRLSMFPPEITAIAGCTSTPEEQRFGLCKP
jgi:hypothetical protein